MRKYYILLLCVWFTLTGCGLKQNTEEIKPKEGYKTGGKQPDNLDEALLEYGYKVVHVDLSEHFYGKRDAWEIIHVDEKEKEKWLKMKENGKNTMGLSKIAYYGYMYGDEPWKMFFGENGELGEGVIGISVEESLKLISNKAMTDPKFMIDKDLYPKIYAWLKGTERAKKQVESLEKMNDMFKVQQKFIDDMKKVKFNTMETMHIMTYALMDKGKEQIDTYEWALMKAPYESTSWYTVNFPTNYYPLDTRDDTAKFQVYADTLRLYNGNLLPEYPNSPKISILSDGGSDQGRGAKYILQMLLYDIHQVKTKKPTAYFGEYAYHLVEDYDRAIANYETEMYAVNGFALIEEEKYDEALKVFDKALKLKDNHIASLLGKAKVYLQKGKEDDAVEIYRTVLKEMQVGEVSKELKLKDVASKLVNTPKEYVLIDIILSLNSIGEYEEIEDTFGVIAKEGDNSVISFYYGDALMRMGKCKEGVEFIGKSKKEVNASIKDEDLKKVAIKKIEDTLAAYSESVCKKQAIDNEVINIDFEIEKGTNKVVWHIPPMDGLIQLSVGQTVKIHHKNMDPDLPLKVLVSADTFSIDAVPHEGRVTMPVEEYTIRAIKKGQGTITIAPNADLQLKDIMAFNIK